MSVNQFHGTPRDTDPSSQRAFMQTNLDRYLGGQQLTPRVRVNRKPEEFPRTTQDLVRSLQDEWAQLDADTQWFIDCLGILIELNANKPTDTKSATAARFGRNAIQVGFVHTDGPDTRVEIGILSLDDYSEQFGDTVVEVDGENIKPFDLKTVHTDYPLVVGYNGMARLIGAPDKLERVI